MAMSKGSSRMLALASLCALAPALPLTNTAIDGKGANFQ
jgi:hypothetical protein